MCDSYFPRWRPSAGPALAPDECLMPPVVTGAVVAVTGLNLAPIAVKSATGSGFDASMALLTVVCVGSVAVFTCDLLQRLLSSSDC